MIGPAATDPTLKTIYANRSARRLASRQPTGFKGYIIAVCNFQLAHGYALFSDTGIRNWATGYLALVLPTGPATATAATSDGPGARAPWKAPDTKRS